MAEPRGGKRRAGRGARNRRRVVTVIGSGTTTDRHGHEVGRLIATMGFDLLTGAGRGVMEAVSRAFFEVSPRRGLVIGVVPAEVAPLEAVETRQSRQVRYSPPPGYPNEWVEIAIFTHLPDSGAAGTLRSSRNHVNVLSADAIVALPGQEGTTAEVWLAIAYGVPIVAYGDHPGEPPYGIHRASTIEEVRRFLRPFAPSLLDGLKLRRSSRSRRR